MKVAVFADFHFSEPKDLELLATLKRQLIAESPDVILFAGDYIGSHSLYETASRDTIVRSLEALAYPTPAYAVLGNHDNWDSHDAWNRAFDNSTIQLVEGSVSRLSIHGATICIRGLGDAYSNHWEYVEIPLTCKGRTITLTHDPVGLLTPESQIETVSFAGHTHCGQISFPLIGAPFIPTAAPKDMHCGYFTIGKAGVVSGGFGTSIVPIRIGSSTAPGWELIDISSPN